MLRYLNYDPGLPGDQQILMSYWASPEGDRAHDAQMQAIVASLKIIGLLAVAIWAFCRAYYFAFYVIDHYIDPSQRYAGLVDFLRRRRDRPATAAPDVDRRDDVS